MMDADAADGLQDWEVLHSNSDPESGPVPNFNDFQPIDAHSEGIIQADYFSVDPLGSRFRTVSGGGYITEVSSEVSDNPSWLDPDLDTGYPRKDAAGEESWPDSGSDRSDDRKFSELEGNSGVGSDGNKLLVGSQGTEEVRGGKEKTLENFDKFWSNYSGIEFDPEKVENFEQQSQLGSKESANLEAFAEENGQRDSENEGNSVEVETGNAEQKEEGKKGVVWWKVPINFLRYCVFRANPVWTFSVAAAAMGLVILGRRLYKMKRKTHGLELKVTMDDKKISQFMSKAARLNEAFSVVKRVPVIRPSLPAVGVTPWPVVSLR